MCWIGPVCTVFFWFVADWTGSFSNMYWINWIDQGAALLYYVPDCTGLYWFFLCTGLYQLHHVPVCTGLYRMYRYNTGPLGPGARAPWPRGLGPLAQGPGPLGPGTLAQGTLRTGFMNQIEPESILLYYVPDCTSSFCIMYRNVPVFGI